MKYGLLLILLVVAAQSLAQWSPSVNSFDTIKIDFRTGGKLDSLDLLFRSLQTAPISSADLHGGIVPVDFLFSQSNGLFIGVPNTSSNEMRYSGLPHIGFAYGFGAAGIQTAKMQYEQVFAKKILVNLDFLNDRANGLLRNSTHKSSDVRLSMINRSDFYTFKLTAEDLTIERGLNGGLGAQSNVVDFPLIFQPVRKMNADENTRVSQVKLENFFDFRRKDSLVSIGFTSEHSLNVRRRVFTEVDVLADHYTMIYIDSFSTRDSYQWSSTSHDAGLFYKAGGIFASASATGRYWKYFNMGNELDTLELGLREKIQFARGLFSIAQEGKLNVIGAGREWETNVLVKYRSGRLAWSGVVNLESKWPDVFLRSYSANNFQYQLAEYTRQFRASFANDVRLEIGKAPLLLKQESVFLKDNYFWNGSNWQNDLYPQLSFHALTVGSEVNYKILNIHPQYTFSISDAPVKLRPDHVFRSRFFVKGGLFKGKKPLAYIGADVIWQSEYGLLDLVPAMGTYVLSNSSPLQSAYLNLHAFAGFQIDEFRFYLRFENIGYFWNDRQIQVVNGYTLPSGILRLGLTWDFFN
jgi:hypothetical protein